MIRWFTLKFHGPLTVEIGRTRFDLTSKCSYCSFPRLLLTHRQGSPSASVILHSLETSRRSKQQRRKHHIRGSLHAHGQLPEHFTPTLAASDFFESGVNQTGINLGCHWWFGDSCSLANWTAKTWNFLESRVPLSCWSSNLWRRGDWVGYMLPRRHPSKSYDLRTFEKLRDPSDNNLLPQELSEWTIEMKHVWTPGCKSNIFAGLTNICFWKLLLRTQPALNRIG